MKILSLFVCLIFLLSCNEPELLEMPGIDLSGDVVLFDNFSQIKLIDHPLRITKTRIEKDSLIINVEYSGGCTKHDFKLFIGKWILKSNPSQAELYLSHNSNGDMCEAYIRREIKFDLTLLKNWFANSMKLKGELILRIYEPRNNEPFKPMLSYFL
ncbi:MAG: hypothetical protein HY963_06985 [Ignavibacteriales bacterium]|nr:hypothetical protein [Ignavibacteriales bacterium]